MPLKCFSPLWFFFPTPSTQPLLAEQAAVGNTRESVRMQCAQHGVPPRDTVQVQWLLLLQELQASRGQTSSTGVGAQELVGRGERSKAGAPDAWSGNRKTLSLPGHQPMKGSKWWERRVSSVQTFPSYLTPAHQFSHL